MKHAYLIMAHNEFSLLKKLVKFLDHSENSLYIHIDSAAADFNASELLVDINLAKVVFIERKKIRWGGASQIDCVLRLLCSATDSQSDYYHLLSGVDIPVVSHSDMLKFFNENRGKEFLGFDKAACETKSFYDRIQYFHPLRDHIVKNSSRKYKLEDFAERAFVKLQKALKINRLKHSGQEYYKGSNWFSITGEAAKYLAAHADQIRKEYKSTFCADEVFVQTAIMNSEYKDRVVKDNKRFVDWKRGSPYTFTLEDFELIKQSHALWARKFSEQTDREITKRLYSSVM